MGVISGQSVLADEVLAGPDAQALPGAHGGPGGALYAVYGDKYKFEKGLVEKLAEEAATDAAYLPLLQVTLEEIWRQGSLKLKPDTNLTDAIQKRANLVLQFRDFDKTYPQVKRGTDEQAMMLDILLDLVSVSPDDDPKRDVRQPQTKAALPRSQSGCTRDSRCWS